MANETDNGVFLDPTTGNIIASGNVQANKIVVPSDQKIMLGHTTLKDYVQENGGKISRIVAGDNITISPESGTGEVTINASGGGGSGLTGHTVTFSPILDRGGFGEEHDDDLYGKIVLVKSDGSSEAIEIRNNSAWISLRGRQISDVVEIHLQDWYSSDNDHKYRGCGVSSNPPYSITVGSRTVKTGYGIGIVVSNSTRFVQIIPMINTSMDYFVSEKAIKGIFSSDGKGDIDGYSFCGLHIDTDVTIEFVLGRASCLLKGTRITLSDYTTKLIEDITYDDELLVWDFDNGCYSRAKPIWIKRAEIADYWFVNKYASGKELLTTGQSKTGWGHRHFDITRNEFRYTPTTVGDEIMTTNGPDEHISSQKRTGSCEYYNIITERHFNLFANGILTSCSLNNLYPIKDMKFVKDDRPLRNIEEYNGIDQKYFDSLRLSEQNINIEELTKYVNNLKIKEI